MRQYRNQILPSWDRRSRMVQGVLNRLVPASGLEDAQWEVHVIDDPRQMNAFVIPESGPYVPYD